MKAISEQEKQLRKQRVKKEFKKTWKGKKLRSIMLLRDNLNYILKNFDMNFTIKGKNILKKAATDEKMINYNNLFLKADD